MGRDLGIPVFLRVALTPTVYTLIGVHPDEAEVLAPTRTGQKGSYVRHLHRVLPPRLTIPDDFNRIGDVEPVAKVPAPTALDVCSLPE